MEDKLKIKYKTGDIIYWSGAGSALIRILTINPHRGLEKCIDPTATNTYNSLHLSNVRYATPLEIEILGQEDFLEYKAQTKNNIGLGSDRDDLLDYLKQKFGS